MDRKRKLFYTTVASLVFQLTTILTGFVLPRMILDRYGSEVNGLVNSIQQFLQFISMLELGVGAVVQSSLYKPLSMNDNALVSKILRSANRFFRKLAYILLVYVVALIIFYPFLVVDSFEWVFTATLIAAMSISSFAQYYFGVVDRLLLTADQKGYIQYTAQTITLLGNTVACFALIQCGASIHFVKLVTSLIYLIRPLFLRYYVNTHYSIDRKISYSIEPIQQKWNGVAQHVASVVLDGTDSMILTIFASLSDVSVYNVYHMIVYGIKHLFTSLGNGIHAYLGSLWAKQELDELRESFNWIEWLFHTGVTFVFGCTGVLIIPFVQVYTRGISDVDYIKPLFAILIVAAHAVHCLRLPYNSLILAGGHYKQTQSNYIIAAILNICVSILVVSNWGLVGVAIGTLVAMVYQTIWMAIYDSKHFLCRSMFIFVKHILLDIVSIGIGVLLTSSFIMADTTYSAWIIHACRVSSLWLICVFTLNFLFYNNMTKRLIKYVVTQAKGMIVGILKR